MKPPADMTQRLEAWLLAVALGHVIGGLALPLLVYSGGFDFYAELIRAEFWGDAPMPVEAAAFQRWIVALFGPTIAGWGVLMAGIVQAGRRITDPWPWNTILLSIFVWVPADIVLSLRHAFWFHAVIDLFVVLIIVVPTLIIRRHKARLRSAQRT